MKLFLHQTDPFPLVLIKVKTKPVEVEDPFKIFETFNFSNKQKESKQPEKFKEIDFLNQDLHPWRTMSKEWQNAVLELRGSKIKQIQFYDKKRNKWHESAINKVSASLSKINTEFPYRVIDIQHYDECCCE